MAQAKVITDPETFKPITLQITLETQGEVNAFYEVVNSSTDELVSFINQSSPKYLVARSALGELLDVIFNALKPHAK